MAIQNILYCKCNEMNKCGVNLKWHGYTCAIFLVFDVPAAVIACNLVLWYVIM